MSDQARFWSRRIRGLNIAEHAVAFRLGDYHNAQTGLCYPRYETLCFELESSRVYLQQIIQRMERWRFLARASRFESPNNRQTSNMYLLSLDRFFPDPKPAKLSESWDERDQAALDGASIGRTALGIVRDSITNKTLSTGILSCYLERVRQRASARKKSADRLWIAVEGESHHQYIVERLPSLATSLRKKIEGSYEIEILACYMKKRFD